MDNLFDDWKKLMDLPCGDSESSGASGSNDVSGSLFLPKISVNVQMQSGGRDLCNSVLSWDAAWVVFL